MFLLFVVFIGLIYYNIQVPEIFFILLLDFYKNEIVHNLLVKNNYQNGTTKIKLMSGVESSKKFLIVVKKFQVNYTFQYKLDIYAWQLHSSTVLGSFGKRDCNATL